MALRSGEPIDHLLPAAIAAGFRGVWIDTFGYADGGAGIVGEVERLTGAPASAVSSEGRHRFYDLTALSARIDARAAGDRIAAGFDLLHPVGETWTGGFYAGAEGDGTTTWHWARATGVLELDNPDRGARTVTVRLGLLTPGTGASTVTVALPGATVRRLTVRGGQARPLRATLTLPPGRSAIRFSTDAPDETSDPRDLRLRVVDTTIEDGASMPSQMPHGARPGPVREVTAAGATHGLGELTCAPARSAAAQTTQPSSRPSALTSMRSTRTRSRRASGRSSCVCGSSSARTATSSMPALSRHRTRSPRRTTRPRSTPGIEAAYAARTYAQALAPLLRQLPGRGGAMDVGTGEGAFLDELLALGFADVAGVEPSAEPIRAASERLARARIRHGIFRRDVAPPASLSLVTCFMTIEHVADPRRWSATRTSCSSPAGRWRSSATTGVRA